MKKSEEKAFHNECLFYSHKKSFQLSEVQAHALFPRSEKYFGLARGDKKKSPIIGYES